MQNSNEEISQRISKIRKSKELSQEYVSAQLGISQQAYNKIERGTTKIGITRLLKIAEILEVELNQFLFDDSEKIIPSKEDINEGLKLIQHLNSEVEFLRAQNKTLLNVIERLKS
ncbi:MAG: helix-turn-helix transcriptional regulator [Vicingaceae bacterium]